MRNNEQTGAALNLHCYRLPNYGLNISEWDMAQLINLMMSILKDSLPKEKKKKLFG